MQQTTSRQEKGRQLAQTARITKTATGWQVPSESGKGHYLVISNGQETTCSCPDHEMRRCKCKHIFAVEFSITKTIDEQGNVTLTKTIRKTYTQNWKAYNQSQQVEKAKFMQLLGDITSRVPQPPYTFGRPTLPIGDMIFGMVFKTYSTFSGRRFTSDMTDAKEKGLVTEQPHYNSLFNYFAKKELTSVLCDIVTLTSLPLRTVEKDFALDSTGFGTGNFQRWYSFKHGKEISSRRWVKCHFMTGVKTNIVTSVKVTSELDNDCPQLPELVGKTAEHFEMREVSGDKAYLSVNNLEVINDVGARAFIPFKSNSQANGNGMLWKKLYHYFQLNNEDFLSHYHKRSNAETTVFMIKAKFGDAVRSKSWTAQLNEVLCKVIAHNICCLIQEMYELEISQSFDFQTSKKSVSA